jgi:hypothetical protein
MSSSLQLFDGGKTAVVTVTTDTGSVLTATLHVQPGYVYTPDDEERLVALVTAFPNDDEALNLSVIRRRILGIAFVAAKEVGPPKWDKPRFQLRHNIVRVGWRFTAYSLSWAKAS